MENQDNLNATFESTTPTVTVKLSFHSDLRRFSVNQKDLTLAFVHGKASTLWGFDLRLKYVDGEGDLVTVPALSFSPSCFSNTDCRRLRLRRSSQIDDNEWLFEGRLYQGFPFLVPPKIRFLPCVVWKGSILYCIPCLLFAPVVPLGSSWIDLLFLSIQELLPSTSLSLRSALQLPFH